MTLPLPGRAEDPEAQRSLDQLARQFPLSATELHTTTATTSGPTTTSTADPMTAVIPEMSVTANFGGYPIIAMFTGSFTHSVSGGQPSIQIFDGGTARGRSRRFSQAPAAGARLPLSTIEAWTPAAGSRTIDVRWNTVAAGTVTAEFDLRQLVILELRL